MPGRKAGLLKAAVPHNPIRIPGDATYDELADIHNELLHLHPDIYIHSRHGRSTEYGVKIKKPVAERICGYMLQTGASPLRLSFGLELDDDGETAFTAALIYRNPDGWLPAFVEHSDPELFIAYAWDYLTQKHHYAEAPLRRRPAEDRRRTAEAILPPT